MNKLDFHKLLLFKYISKSIPYKEPGNWAQSHVERSWFQLCTNHTKIQLASINAFQSLYTPY